MTGQLHIPGLRAERVRGQQLCVTVRWVAGASLEWLQRLRQKLTDVPHAGLGEVRCRRPTLNCLCTDRVVFIYRSPGEPCLSLSTHSIAPVMRLPCFSYIASAFQKAGLHRQKTHC